MDDRTLEALKASIAKWERNAVAETPDGYLIDADDCPLCLLFHDDACLGCPIREKTGREFCSGTPYRRADEALYEWGLAESSAADRARENAHAAARKEVAFLKSLLPAGAS